MLDTTIDITIAIGVVASILSFAFTVHTVKTQRDLKAAIHAINNGHAALNECQLGLLHKLKHYDDLSWYTGDRLVKAENQLRSLKRLSDIEDATYLAAHMKDESKRYANLSKSYQAKAKAKAKNMKGVQS
jgi:hypothetical protein